MLRLIPVSFLVTAASVFAQTTEELIVQLESTGNPFTPTITVYDTLGISSVYNSLSKLSGTTFGPEGGGSILMDGSPWMTGEVRDVSVPGGAIPTLFVSLQPPEDGHPATAVFRIVSNQQEISVDVDGFNAPIAPMKESDLAWLIGESTVVVTGSVDDKVELISTKRRAVAFPKFRSSANEVALCEISTSGEESWRAASPTYSGPVMIISPRIPVVTVDRRDVNQRAIDAVFGAAVVTPEGALVGILGREGLVKAEDLGLSSNAGVIPSRILDRVLYSLRK